MVNIWDIGPNRDYIPYISEDKQKGRPFWGRP